MVLAQGPELELVQEVQQQEWQHHLQSRQRANFDHLLRLLCCHRAQRWKHFAPLGHMGNLELILKARKFERSLQLLLLEP
jgi:hypothetical protein